MIVELLDGADQAHVAFLDQIQERHASADVLLCDRHDQPEVGLRQPLLGLVGALVAFGQAVPRDPIRLQRLGANARACGSVGRLAAALRGGGVDEVL